MANKMEAVRKWFGESTEPRIVELVEGCSATNLLIAGRENMSMLRELAGDLKIPYPSSMHIETLRARIVLEVERAFRAEEQRTYAKESK